MRQGRYVSVKATRVMAATAQTILNGFRDTGLVKTYTIAFSPRCGSTVLSRTLAHLGLGQPTEYFQYPYDSNDFFSESCGSNVLDRFHHAVLAHVRNGIFSSKMTHDHRAHLDGHLKSQVNGYRSIDDLLPGHKWIFMRRTDAVAQALSWYVAEMSNSWHAVVAEESVEYGDIEYDFFSILSKVMIIGANNANWETQFGLLGIQPHVVVYENLVANPSREISQILKHLDVEMDVSNIDLERDGRLKQMSKVSNDIYRSLHDRFIDDFMKIGQTDDRDRLGAPLDKWNSFFFQSRWRDA